MYGTVEGGNAFFAQRLNSWEWENASESDKAKALNQAAEIIDQFQYVEFETVPETFATAAYLIAKALLSGRDPEMDLEHLATSSESYGAVRTSYDREGTLQEHIAHLVPSPQAWALLRPWLSEAKVFITKRV